MTTNLPAAHPNPPIIHGRDAELGQIRACLREASAGRGRLILIGGEAGIGKTALVEAAARIAEAGGARVARGGCYDPATPPHGPWIEAFEDLAAQSVALDIPNLFDTHGVPASPTTIREAQSRILAFLMNASSQNPLVIILEDLHWADPDSLALARHLARALPRHPIAVIMTYRDIELAPDQPLHRYLPHLVRESRPLRISLQRFGPDEVREVVRHRYALDPGDESRLVTHLYDHAEGNPFFTEELLRSLEHERILTRERDRWLLGDTALAPVPLLVRQMIDARVAWMDATARALLQIAAVIGAEVPLALWRDVAAIDDIALATAIEQARDAQIITPSPSRPAIRFTHALVREAVYDAITPPRRHVWHRQVAEMLAERDSVGADLVAYHFQQAGDRRATAWLQRAAIAAMQSNAVEDAVERFEAALAVLRDDPPAAAERATILAHLADARRYSDPPRALAYLDEARFHVAASGDRALEAIVLWSRARIRGFLGEVTLEDLREALEAYHSLESSDRDRIHAIGGRLGSGQGPFAQWLAHHGVYR
ncbi:MAG TPA: AAA family ATPase, partial [Thermomicrobiales bacterium]|nr:AAA family ATPase [Thermomicrobiales bacterium]